MVSKFERDVPTKFRKMNGNGMFGLAGADLGISVDYEQNQLRRITLPTRDYYRRLFGSMPVYPASGMLRTC
jgi:hypothetical protein